MLTASDLETGQTNEESDNRLSLNPNDPEFAPTLEQWSDGEEYEVTMKIRQTSPGEFIVVSMQSEAAPAEEGGEQEEANEPPYGQNPAVGGLLKNKPAMME